MNGTRLHAKMQDDANLRKSIFSSSTFCFCFPFSGTTACSNNCSNFENINFFVDQTIESQQTLWLAAVEPRQATILERNLTTCCSKQRRQYICKSTLFSKITTGITQETQTSLGKKHINSKWHSYAELNCTWLANSLHSAVTGLLILRSSYTTPSEQCTTATSDRWPPFKSEVDISKAGTANS